MSDVKLGMILTGEHHRDAIHIAIAPVLAACTLNPGQAVGFTDDTKTEVGQSEKPLGIVDPFLKENVRKGQQFFLFLFLFPQTVTGMRHQWHHPDFPNGDPMDRLAAQRFVDDIASQVRLSSAELMDAAEGWAKHRDYTYENSESYKDIPYETWREFWKHFEVLTGIRIEDADSHPFTCSC
jgi:hypothetical protein